MTKDQLPALWVHEPTGKSRIFDYPFPRNVSDFYEYRDLIVGQLPLSIAQNFKKLPRFGLTGLAEHGNHIYAGSWNGVYVIRKSDFGLDQIITNPMMNDMHGIWVDDKCIITILTGKDTVVFSDFDGKVIEHFSVANDLTLHKNESIHQHDWRFLSKQFRGATGLWHFNYVQRFDDEIWLTARNLGAFIVINLKTRKPYIRTINHKTVILLHDGIQYEKEYYFTSIDGKIIIAAEAANASFKSREEFEGVDKFNRDMACELIRLKETEFGREPNWCRGIACHDDVMYVTVDGLYDTDLSFGLLGLKRDGKKVLESRLQWKDIGPCDELRFVTGFDVVVF